MGLIQAFTGALGGTFADQWRDVITAGHFGELTVVAPGILQQTNNGRGSNYRGSADVISNGSKIFVPENTAAFIVSQGGIEDIVSVPGGYEYQSGQGSVFNGDGLGQSIVRQASARFKFGGQTSDQKWVAFVNLREIRGLKFGTRGPMVYHDRFYEADLEIQAFGSFSLRVVNPESFIRNFLPANTRHYTFDTPAARQQISSEFLQAFIAAVNSLSATHRISELPAHAGAISQVIANDESELGAWIPRFGMDVVQVGIESIEFTPQSRELVKQYAASRMNVSAFDGISQQASNMAAQQKIAQGVQEHGLGQGAGLVFGAGLAQSINPQTAAQLAPATPASDAASALTLEQQIEGVKKLKELLDSGILSPDEFEAKKKQILGL
jgi:membrane protease subunit (stomatin/prohibitin family)